VRVSWWLRLESRIIKTSGCNQIKTMVRPTKIEYPRLHENHSTYITFTVVNRSNHAVRLLYVNHAGGWEPVRKPAIQPGTEQVQGNLSMVASSGRFRLESMSGDVLLMFTIKRDEQRIVYFGYRQSHDTDDEYHTYFTIRNQTMSPLSIIRTDNNETIAVIPPMAVKEEAVHGHLENTSVLIVPKDKSLKTERLPKIQQNDVIQYPYPPRS
jgi:hypothetical protein